MKGVNVKTKSKKQSQKPRSKASPKRKRAVRPVETDREALEAQLSPQEEETYIAHLRAASERAANDVKNAIGELLDDE
jgi:predicted glutamine amidotransferase